MRTIEEIAQELGGTVGRTKFAYEVEGKHVKPKRDNKKRTKQLRQARQFKAAYNG